MHRLVASVVVALVVAVGGRATATAQDATPAPPPVASPDTSLAGVAPLPLSGERLAAFEAYVPELLAAAGLHLDHDIRSLPLLALPDGGFVVASGPDVVLEQPVTFAAGADGVPAMTIQGFPPVRWLTGG